MHFTDLRLSPPILRALAKEGYETPTPIQAQAIPHALDGKDLLGCAQTGTGKTAAFALPILQRLMDMPVDKARRGPAKPRALILSPTRELAIQIRDSFRAYGAETGLRSTVIFGGVSQLRQVQALRDGVDIVIATPGRLIDLMEQRKAHLDEVQLLVLDEADRMLDMGFIQPIRRIAAATPATRQTLFFSATMPPEIQKLAQSLLKDPVKVAVTPIASAAPKIEQSLYHVGRADKQALLNQLLADKSMSRVVVFTKTKHGADKVGRKLYHAGIHAETIHGNKAQNARKKALDLFRAGKARVLVATDVAARGLDVDGITHVVNFDLPMEPEAYVHRIGRTGRAGATGIAISFCDAEERGLLRDIERLIKGRIPQAQTPHIERAIEVHRDPHPSHSAQNGQGSHVEAKPRHAGGQHERPRHAPRPQHGQPNARTNGQSGGTSAARPSGPRPNSSHPNGSNPGTGTPHGAGHGQRKPRPAHGNPHGSSRSGQGGHQGGSWNGGGRPGARSGSKSRRAF